MFFRWIAIGWFVMLLLVVVAILFVANRTIDGHPVGAQVCRDPEEMGRDVSGERWCDTFTNFARQTLDEADPGHAEILGVDAFEPKVGVLLRSGGTDLILALRLADNRVRAFYIGCGVGADNKRCFVGPPDGT
jgi:hypothetical protein